MYVTADHIRKRKVRLGSVRLVSLEHAWRPVVRRREKLVSARTTELKYDYPILENQPESLINEAISLTSMDESFVRLSRIGEPYNLFLQLARYGH